MKPNPTSFDAYWANLDSELSLFNVAPEDFVLARHSSDAFTVSLIRLTSVGPYRISAYLSVPSGEGPFPALLQTPRYGSVNHVPDYTDRLRYICLTLHHRGQRLSDQPYRASYPGLLTDGIEDPEEFVYRGIVADCLVAADYLFKHPRVDPDRVAIVGDDLALLTAARRSGATSIIATNVMFYRLMESRLRTKSYPVEEINDYLRRYPEALKPVEQTLSYFDPLNHASRIDVDTILPAGDNGSLTGEDWLEPLATEIAGDVTFVKLSHRGGEDRDGLDAVLASRMGVEPATRFRRTVAPPFRAG